MAGETPDIIAHERTGTGKGAARQARRDMLVPGIVYGGEQDPLPINLPYNELVKKLKAGRFLATLFNLKVEGHDDVRVICRNVQRDIVKDLPVHVDFMRLRRNSRVSLYIPVEVIDEDDAPGLQSGGVLTMVRNEVELRCTAGDIPEKITVSLAGKDVGDSIHISEVTLPEGTRPTIDRDFVIANIQPPSGLASQSDDEDEVAPDEVPSTEMEDGSENEDAAGVDR
ncbi:50S ribosomal protein L25 [Rhodobacteraceae bacterium THAF1]|uniref:50S ribosomal protein L25/general stress protein Ctc n=1 Tax=Palleronia sp. THAF1 TaxID=2587842 RepID=UPI000F3B501F|nr:50S ribosomal protein L25/general stress protein Ctc [Palleronia sp. THAF1]QFU09448.1 50S ribosomal protein L25 [Palleronia sp. THAF1]VDC21890.1 50S ribosomal protein L25 [Rhodobacteraceae bacterium THAF1]